MSRPNRNDYFMSMAHLVSLRGTCVRRKVGCVLINSRNHVLATGYNGPASGVPHCLDTVGEHDRLCAGAMAKSGTGLDACEAIHAEQNALLQCRDVYSIAACFTTAAPCPHCLKLLMNTSCKTIYYSVLYPGFDAAAWSNSGKDRRSMHVNVSKADAAKFLCT